MTPGLHLCNAYARPLSERHNTYPYTGSTPINENSCDRRRTKNWRLLATGLAEAGFVIDLARDGHDGLHLALTEAYDLAILDIML
jgi:hypothetical protein